MVMLVAGRGTDLDADQFGLKVAERPVVHGVGGAKLTSGPGHSQGFELMPNPINLAIPQCFPGHIATSALRDPPTRAKRPFRRTVGAVG